jgi:glutamyl endopeptidase
LKKNNFSSSNVIVGQDLPDWKVVSNEDEIEFDYTRSVGLLNVRGARCTGFLIGLDTIMTNHHCIPDQKTADSTHLTLQSWKTDYRGEKYLVKKTFLCDQLIINNQELDFALAKCKNAPGQEFGFVKLSEEHINESTSIRVIHHNCDYHRLPSGCSPQRLLSQGNVLPKTDINTFFHTADTLPGSSGAPVFSYYTGEVIGLHNSGYKKEGESKMGKGLYNGAIRINKIVQFINYKLPSFEWPFNY